MTNAAPVSPSIFGLYTVNIVKYELYSIYLCLCVLDTVCLEICGKSPTFLGDAMICTHSGLTQKNSPQICDREMGLRTSRFSLQTDTVFYSAGGYAETTKNREKNKTSITCAQAHGVY